MKRIPFNEAQKTLKDILLKYGFDDEKSDLIASVHVQSSCDGVFSHGLNRFPLFIEYVLKDIVKPEENPKNFQNTGIMEQWDGRYGSGIWNAWTCTGRAIEIAKYKGIGLVTLKNTNHWMRGGTYGWKAAESGMIGICFTNTQPNMPPWGGKESKIGNNPLIIGVPAKSGSHMVLDMSMSQFSFGKMHQYKLDGLKLPFPGGWDEQDQFSNDPEKILKKERGLPIGYWKGSALSIMLDTLATVLSMGNSTFDIGQKGYETGISQVFLCLDPRKFGEEQLQEQMIDQIKHNIHDVDLMDSKTKTRYPGENTLKIRKENMERGVPVNEEVWEKIVDLQK